MKQFSKHLTLVGKLGIIAAILVVAVIGIPSLKNDFIITVDGKELALDVDGVYAEDAMKALDASLPGVEYVIKENIEAKTFLADIGDVTISTRKAITTIINGQEVIDYTYTSSLQEFLSDDTTELFKAAGVIEVETDELLQTGTKFEINTIQQDLGVEHRDNAELTKGTEEVVQEGRAKQTLEIKQHNSDGAEPVLLLSKVLDEGSVHIIDVGTKPLPSIAPAIPSGSVWDQLAACESGGRWNVNTGNGYYGGLQFSAPTWNTASSAVGLNIGVASDATREEQILAATWLQNNSGWGQWPACSKKLGLY